MGPNINVDLPQALARLRFNYRVVARPDGGHFYRLADKSGYVRLKPGEWDQIGELFHEHTAKTARRAKILLLLHLPMFILLMVIINLPPIWQLLKNSPALVHRMVTYATLGFLFLGPVGYYLWHSSRVGRVAAMIDATLLAAPRVDHVIDPIARSPLWLDILCLVLVGPYLIIAIAGELKPHMFDNTPLSGAHLDVLALIGILAIIARLAWPWLAMRKPPK